jgi:16S rRNA (guanine966-N2)-methyltransferase
MAERKSGRSKSAEPRRAGREIGAALGLRIIGGTFRGRSLRYGGDPGVRPMKDRVREAVFNLLGPAVAGKHAVDLFAGTGALGLEALSRGAARATFIEQHFPTARVLKENIATLGVEDRADLAMGNVFLKSLWETRLSDLPWVVFASPPYAFYVERRDEMLGLLASLALAAPTDSLFVVESDERFDFSQLFEAAAWDLRSYPPAYIGIYRKAKA